MALHTDRRPRSTRVSSPELLTRWIPRPLEQLEDRLTPAVLSNSPAWLDAGPNNVTGGQTTNITSGNVIGAISALGAHPTNANILYAGAANGGVWRTLNATAASPTWVPLTDSFPSLSISTISLNPDNPNQIIAGIAGSADGVYAIDANTGARIILDSRGQARGELIGALYSNDGGNTWTVLNNNIGGKSVVGVAVRNTYMLVATDEGVFRSTNNGTTFTRVTGLPTGGAFDLAADPGAAVDVIIGATWSAGTATITTSTAHTLAVGQSVIVTGVNPTGFNGTFLVTAVDVGMTTFSYVLAIDPLAYVSGGNSQSNFNQDPLARNRFYVALRNVNGPGGQGIYRSDNGGVTWGAVTSTSMQIGDNTTNVQIAVFNSGILTNNIVYVAVQNDNPTGSEAQTTGFDHGWVNRLAAVSTISWSPNQGGTWTRMDVPRTVTEEEVAGVASDSAGVITVTAGNRHLLRTGDQVIISGVFDSGDPAATPPIPPALIGPVNGVWYVTVTSEFSFTLNNTSYTGTYLNNLGEWRHILGANSGERSEFFDLAVDPNNSSTVYLGTDRAMRNFYNNGANGTATYTANYWRGNRLNNPTEGFPFGSNTAISSNQWVSITNEGTSNGSAPPADTHDFAISANGQLIAATGGGIYRRTAPTGNGSWNSANGNLGVSGVFSVAYDTLNNRLFAGTIDTQAINQTNSGGFTFTSVYSANTMRNNFLDQANSFRVLADNSRLTNSGAASNQTVRYYVGTNFSSILRRTYDASNNVVTSSAIDFASPLSTTIPGSGLTLDPQGPNANENVRIAMALNQNDQRRAIFGYNGLYEDADPSGLTPTGDIVNDVTPRDPITNAVLITGQVEQLLYGGKRGGVNFNQVVYFTTSTGQLWVRGEFGPDFTDISVNTGETGPIFAVIGDPDDYRRIFVAQGDKILESRNFGQTFTDISNNLIGPETADGTAGPGTLTTEIRTLAIFDANPGASVSGDITLLAGGRGGVFRLSANPSCTDAAWSEYGQSLPNTVVNDLQLYNNRRLIAGTAGRGIWMIDDISTTINQDVILTITGTAGADTISVQLDPNNPSAIVVNDGVNAPQSYTRGTFTRLVIDAGNGADTIVIGSGDLSFINFAIQIDAGTDGAGDSIILDNRLVNTATRVTLTPALIGGGTGDTLFVGCGNIAFTGMADLGDLISIRTGAGNDTYVLSGLIAGTTLLDGGDGSETYTYAMSAASTSTLNISDTGVAGTDRIAITGTAVADFFTVTPTAITLGSNTVLYNGNIEGLTVSGGLGNDSFNIQGVVSTTNTFNGDGGNDNFNFLSALGSASRTVIVNGGTGTNGYAVVGVAGNESVGIDIASALGTGSFTGLRQSSTFTSIQNVAFDGSTGTNAFAWRDRTNGNYGTPTTPETGVIYTPIDTTSGNIRVGTGTFPTVFFTNVNSSLVLNGDPDGSGDRDILTVQGFSTAGLQSGGPFNESTSADGSDTFTVNDQFVAMSNAALGALRTVSFGTYADGTPTFRMINVRGGNEAVTGDRFTATPSLRTNIVINGMNPTSGANGDQLTILSSGQTTRSRVNDPAVGPIQTRVVQSSNGAGLGYLNIEQVTVTDTSPGGGGGAGGGGAGGVNTEGFYAVASDVGAPARVQVYNRLSGTVRYDFDPFPGFMGGIRVAVGDVDGDGTQDIVVAAGPNGPPHVKVFSGADGSLIASFYAYGVGFTGGVDVAVADLNGDGYAEIITGSGPGAGPHIKVFDGFDFTQTASYYAFDATFLGGIRVAVGDTNGDGTPDLIVGAQAGAEPRVTVFDGKTNAVLQNFFAFDPAFTGGVYVACGDINGDGFADVIIGAGTGDLPNVKVIDGRNGVELASFLANAGSVDVVGSVPFEGGVRVATVDFDGDGIDEILTAKGPGTFPILRFYKLGVGVVTQAGQLQVFGSNYGRGVYVGG